jgi:hypothetical protein
VARSLLRLARWPLTLVLGAMAIVAAAVVVSSLHQVPTPSAPAEARHDEAAVIARYRDCRAFSARGCSTRVVRTDALGSTFVAVEIASVSGDGCDRGLVYFFDAETLVTSSAALEPRSRAGVVALRARPDGTVVVGYALSPSRLTSCAKNGSAGVDDYRYALQGGTVIVVAGSLPAPPVVIVGSRADH